MNRKGNKKAPNLRRLGLQGSLLDFFGLTNGAGGRNRTDTDVNPLDFESSASCAITMLYNEFIFYINFPAIYHVV